ncbi:hypothetical protein H072_4478 [Dactylellina haptotyla CBS 200.50]|uniref:Uncharacterized protein n=1 Tax=Dactylellina haptotyla (strain CBS 200.50) TaxID=1284197 RepID=S8C1Y3_DACHA|nr:hypothetical protein H072_4478 [Dactylellina haptotyla CBS 200.50]
MAAKKKKGILRASEAKKKKKKISESSEVPQIDLSGHIDTLVCVPDQKPIPSQVELETDDLRQGDLKQTERRLTTLAASLDEPNDNLSERKPGPEVCRKDNPLPPETHSPYNKMSFWGDLGKNWAEATKKASENMRKIQEEFETDGLDTRRSLRERSTASKDVVRVERIVSEYIPSRIERALSTSTESDSIANPPTPMDSSRDLTVSPRLDTTSSPQTISQDITENIIYITEDGNYCLQVVSGCCHHKFIVSKTIISHASEKLRSEIQKAAGHPLFGDMKLLKITEGSPEAWNVILQILHFCMDESFFNLDVRIITEITAICTRYALQNPLMTWVRLWLQQNSTKLWESDFEDWIFPAIEFGTLKDEVEKFTQLLSDQCSALSDCGTRISRSGVLIRTECWPQSFLDSVLKMRLGKIESLLEKLGFFSDFFLKDEETLRQNCTDEACISLAYGSISRSLSKSRLLDIRNGEQYAISLTWHDTVDAILDDQFAKYHPEPSQLIEIPTPGINNSSKPETATIWSIATTVVVPTENIGPPRISKPPPTFEEEVYPTCYSPESPGWGSAENTDEYPESSVVDIASDIADQISVVAESESYNSDIEEAEKSEPNNGPIHSCEKSHPPPAPPKKKKENTQELETNCLKVDAAKISRPPSIVSFKSIWPADIDSIASRRAKDPNFQPPPARSLSHTPNSTCDLRNSIRQSLGSIVFTISESSECSLNVLHQNTTFQYRVSQSILNHSSKLLAQETVPHTKDVVELLALQESKVLLDVDPDAMHRVLKLLHFDAGEDDFDIEFNDLRQVAIICKRFELQRALRSWTRVWMDQQYENATEPGNEDWLFISDVLDDSREVESLISDLSEECSAISDCDSYLLRDGVLVSTELWPEKHIKAVFKRRQSQVENIVNSLRMFLQSFLTDESRLQSLCNDENCIDIAYESLLRSVRKLGLWHLLNYGEEWYGSLIDLKSKIASIEFNTLATVGLEHQCSMGNLEVELSNLVF